MKGLRDMADAIDLQVLCEFDLKQPIGQLRACPVNLGPGSPRTFLVTYCADFDVDPYVEMFFFPSDTLKMALLSEGGEILWTRDLGPGVVPGVWFCPVFPFDLNGDGVDEIWYVGNTNPDHPLGLNSYVLECVDAATGETTGQWPWHHVGNSASLGHTFRNFIVGGFAKDEPVLVTCQGTYADMHFQAWSPGMQSRWTRTIGADEPGARGSHMCPITDFDGDGVQELMWGERCIGLADGSEIFCADRDTWHSHSDIILPTLDRATGQWYFYTCREGDGDIAPRVALYDAGGNRVWGDVDRGHIDMGWVARLGDDARQFAMAIRIGAKTCGPDGRFHQECDEFAWDTLTGEPVKLPFSVYRTLPVDLSGDGYHELVRGVPGGDGEVLDRHGNVIGNVGGACALLSKFMDHPGEQLLSYQESGKVQVWADRNARDSDLALSRYAHPLYRTNERLFGVGYNLNVLGGL